MKENDGELVSKNDKFFSENLTVRFKNGKKFCGRLLTVWSISPRAGIRKFLKIFQAITVNQTCLQY
jgi:hypothetical protein